MKKLILIALATFISVQNYGQTYIPLPLSDAKWCIKHNDNIIPPPIWWYTNYWETSYCGDTTISNKKYIKIEKTEYDIFCLNTVINGPEYIGAIRDDTTLKQVFFVPKNETDEKLLYDFNLNAGDTLLSYLNMYQPLIVEFTDSVLLGNIYHKRILFQYNQAEIIEGIGSRTGIIEDLIAFEGGSYLCAFYIDTNLIFPETPCNLSLTDTCWMQNTQHQPEKPEISIFPNPAGKLLYVELQSDLLLYNPVVKIISANGKICKNLKLSGEITKMDLSGFTPGIYAVRIITDNNVVINKKIIISE